jgi:hypothetical protein
MKNKQKRSKPVRKGTDRMKGKVLAEEKADRIQGKSFQKPMDFVGNTY